MSDLQIGHLAYLALLLAVVGYAFVQNRQGLNKTLQQAALWGLIFLGAIAVFGLWDDIRQTVRPSQAVFADSGRVEVPRAPDGHFYLTLDVNGQPLRFVVDTGATGVVLSRADAARAGLDPEDLMFLGRAMTANGEVRTAPVRLDRMTLGGFTETDLPAWVNEGELETSLLGMTYLDRWSRIEITSDRMVLTR
ncbi:MAG: TIGR02281 family clan AA aspartic protease [Rhodobacteraceae bacterium]|nr:MAG: TIGR02281 family clan AA aspartic protease [Paracoccaceae bacterium]